MWIVLEKRQVTKKLKRLPRPVLVRYEAWKRIVEVEGVAGLRRIKGFHDEALKGQWQGNRSSRLGLQWRVIYRVEGQALKVLVMEVNPHDY